MKVRTRTIGLFTLIGLFGALIAGCANNAPVTVPNTPSKTATYVIGPGDSLEIYVRNNKDLTTKVPVRPDGRISIPLVQSIKAGGKTPDELAHDIENQLKAYIRQPLVTVIVTGFVGAYSEQVRVVGQAVTPKALSYRQGMTLLDTMIAVGGLTKFADGNDAKIVRRTSGKEQTIQVHLGDLLDGDVKQNVKMQPGDILIIPESTF